MAWASREGRAVIPPEQRAVLDAYWEMLFREDEMLRQSYTPPIVSLVPRFAAEQEVGRE